MDGFTTPLNFYDVALLPNYQLSGFNSTANELTESVME